jgi:hypothetical protein
MVSATGGRGPNNLRFAPTRRNVGRIIQSCRIKKNPKQILTQNVIKKPNSPFFVISLTKVNSPRSAIFKLLKSVLVRRKMCSQLL